jgi:hypothetical protein
MRIPTGPRPPRDSQYVGGGARCPERGRADDEERSHYTHRQSWVRITRDGWRRGWGGLASMGWALSRGGAALATATENEATAASISRARSGAPRRVCVCVGAHDEVCSALARRRRAIMMAVRAICPPLLATALVRFLGTHPLATRPPQKSSHHPVTEPHLVRRCAPQITFCLRAHTPSAWRHDWRGPDGIAAPRPLLPPCCCGDVGIRPPMILFGVAPIPPIRVVVVVTHRSGNGRAEPRAAAAAAAVQDWQLSCRTESPRDGTMARSPGEKKNKCKLLTTTAPMMIEQKAKSQSAHHARAARAPPTRCSLSACFRLPLLHSPCAVTKSHHVPCPISLQSDGPSVARWRLFATAKRAGRTFGDSRQGHHTSIV